jgi:hypothetical protein
MYDPPYTPRDMNIYGLKFPTVQIGPITENNLDSIKDNILVLIPGACRTLGVVEVEHQVDKIRGYGLPIADFRKVAVLCDGKVVEMWALALKWFPVWILNINTSLVFPSVRDVLKKLREIAADGIWEAFKVEVFGLPPTPKKKVVEATSTDLVEMRRGFTKLLAGRDVVKLTAHALAATRERTDAIADKVAETAQMTVKNLQALENTVIQANETAGVKQIKAANILKPNIGN